MITRKLPERISRLDELANNLWWSWHDQAREVFRSLDYQLWRITGNNPARLLRKVSPETLQSAAEDPLFFSLYDSVMAAFDADMSASRTWFATNHPRLLSGPVAYFSMEFAIHNSLPIYAGGLGILSGDICKEASELGLPLVAVGFMYPQGYFRQRISTEGWQEEIYEELNFEELPINRVLSPTGQSAIAWVELGEIQLAIGVWRVQVGRTNIYLLDTNIKENPAEYRQLSARLYTADKEQRIQQEIILGVGGVRVLQALGINPAVWHANEGHTAFMMVERLREEVVKGVPFSEAINTIRASTVFTTHTPVMAGHDIFPLQVIEKYLHSCCNVSAVDWEKLLKLGQEVPGSQALNMTALALRMANQRCAVSQLHKGITQKMWHGLWPEVPEADVPITSVTNGIHVPTWIAREMYYLLEKYLGKDWINSHDVPELWDRVFDIPDEELWVTRLALERKLVGNMREHGRWRWVRNNMAPNQLLVMGALLSPETLTIGFARRFTEYKRPSLVFHDVERLKRIITDQWRPLQVIFAGKSHSADFASKYLLQRVYNLAADPEFQGRIAFIEDYDMHMAHHLVQGVDVWLNTPRRLQEACGTSGMKASLNGVLHLSVRDGWWHEGYNKSNGWVLGEDLDVPTPQKEDDIDAEAFYRLLEEEIVPLYYARDRGGVPHGWLRLVKEAIRSVVPFFSARRMLKEYTEKIYRTAAEAPRMEQR